MAVTFLPNGGSEYVIGGQTTVSGNGVAGPFPRYSISKEPNTVGNVVLQHKYTINIAGVALISGSMLSAGVRQSAIHEDMDEILDLQSKVGVLEIAPYGGQAKILKFTDAKVVSVEAVEQDEESAGVQFQNYNFTFEAYRKLTPSDDKGDLATDALQGVVSIEESWETSLLEGEYSEFKKDGSSSTATLPHKVWSISHSVSAVGVSTGNAFTDNTTTITDNTKAMGYQHAKKWVESRLKGNPLENATATTDLKGFSIDLVVNDEADSSPYKTYNHIRTVSQDIVGGTYSVTETWTASRFPATHNIEYSFESPEDGEYDTVTATLSVQGLETNSDTDGAVGTPGSFNVTTSDKYANALTNFDVVKASVHSGATTFYTTAGGGATLKTEPVSQSRSDNETLGTINYTAVFNDKPVETDGATDEGLTVTFNNTDHTVDDSGTVTTQGNQIVAIIPILAKPDGPVIQDMKTTNEKTISVSYNLTMGKEWRDENKPTENIDTKPNGDAIVNKYKPEGGYRQNRVESWNPYNGQYNLDVDWVFNGNFSYANGGGGGGGGGGGDDPETISGYRFESCDYITTPGLGTHKPRHLIRNPTSVSLEVGNIATIITDDGEQKCAEVTEVVAAIAESASIGSYVLNGPYFNCVQCKTSGGGPGGGGPGPG